MDTRRLHAFVKIVDIGSLTRAAAILHIAQPALSHQMAALEAHFGQQLLVRSKRGVMPTNAGRVLYRHAQFILRHLEQVEIDIKTSASVIAGRVSVGLAPFSTATALAAPLLQTVRRLYPHITLQIHENIGGLISEMIMTGKMDLAFIYEAGAIRGVDFEPILTEDMFFVGSAALLDDPAAEEVPFDWVAGLDLMLPTRIHTIRQLVNTTFRRHGGEPRVIAEIESVPIMARAVRDGLGATILPWSSASTIVEGQDDIVMRRIVRPVMQVKVSLCTSDQWPLSEPAMAVSEILAGLARDFIGQYPSRGIEVVARPAARGGKKPL